MPMKPVEGTNSVCQFTTFQSASSCNINHVNALSECQLFTITKESGRGNCKRQWGIKMNESRQLCLGSHGVIDVLDHLIEHGDLFHRSWKHWHVPTVHCKAMIAAAACDIHLECCEGNSSEDWKVTKPVSFHRFHEKLAKQQLRHDPRHRNCPGDEFFRVSTQQPIGRRHPSISRSPTRAGSGNASVAASVATSTSVTSEQPQAARTQDCVTTCPSSSNTEHRCKRQRSTPTEFVPSVASPHTTSAPFAKMTSTRMVCLSTSLRPQHRSHLFLPVSQHVVLRIGETRHKANWNKKRKDCCFPTDQTIVKHASAIKRLREQEAVVLRPTTNIVNNENEVQVVAADGDVLVRNGKEHGVL